MANKKNLTVRQKQKKYARLSKLLFASEYVAIVTPFIILGAINFQDWFIQESGWKVGIGASISLALITIITTLITKKKEEASITNGFVSLVLGWYATAFCLVLLQSILHDIAQIMLIGGTGMIAACGLNVLSNDYKNKANTLKEIIGEAEKDTFKEQAKKEFEKEEGINHDDYDGTSI